jgi:hypothetical protein
MRQVDQAHIKKIKTHTTILLEYPQRKKPLETTKRWDLTEARHKVVDWTQLQDSIGY